MACVIGILLLFFASLIPLEAQSFAEITGAVSAIDGGSAIRTNSGDTLWPVNNYNLAAGFQCQKDNRIEFRNIKLLPIKN